MSIFYELLQAGLSSDDAITFWVNNTSDGQLGVLYGEHIVGQTKTTKLETAMQELEQAKLALEQAQQNVDKARNDVEAVEEDVWPKDGDEVWTYAYTPVLAKAYYNPKSMRGALERGVVFRSLEDGQRYERAQVIETKLLKAAGHISTVHLRQHECEATVFLLPVVADGVIAEIAIGSQIKRALSACSLQVGLGNVFFRSTQHAEEAIKSIGKEDLIWYAQYMLYGRLIPVKVTK